MKVEILGSYGGESIDCRMTCLLLNDTIALDAGSLSQTLPIERQRLVTSIVLTHSHMDHTSSLPFFIENVFGKLREAVDIYASPATIYALRRHLFNNDTWPDFTRLPNHLLPVIRFHELHDEVPITIGAVNGEGGVRFTPIPVNHVVPTYGFLIENGGSSFLWSSDTGPTQRLWEIANRTPSLKGIWVDASFDNAMQGIADVSGHLTPATVAAELRKLERRVPILLHHLKPPCIEQIQREIAVLENPDIGFLEQGRVYEL
ncbi:MAG: 3',5'-cyclic-nucleotide phosphodiesterase [Thermoanaerobaculia bacterium]